MPSRRRGSGLSPELLHNAPLNLDRALASKNDCGLKAKSATLYARFQWGMSWAWHVLHVFAVRKVPCGKELVSAPCIEKR